MIHGALAYQNISTKSKKNPKTPKIEFVIIDDYGIISAMKKTGFVWKIYLFAYSIYLLGNIGKLLIPGAFANLYYHTLIAFHPFFLIPYDLALIQAFFNLFNLIPLFLYVFRIHFLSARFWQAILVARVIFDLTGHSVEINNAMAIYHANREWFLSTIALWLIMAIPSYGACFQYAFKWTGFEDKNFALTK